MNPAIARKRRDRRLKHGWGSIQKTDTMPVTKSTWGFRATDLDDRRHLPGGVRPVEGQLQRDCFGDHRRAR